MQKKVIVLALAALASGAAMAQTNVTVYGIMDAFVGVSSANNANGNQKAYTMGSGGNAGSRIGFKGEEALGNGLKAIFTLELGNLTNDMATNNITASRESIIGLKSDAWGTVMAGRIQGGGYWWPIKYDAAAQNGALSPAAQIINGSWLLSASGAARLQNAVSYISPTIASGLVLRVDTATGEQVTGSSTLSCAGTSGTTGCNNAEKYYSLNADYENGPLSVGGIAAQKLDAGGTMNGAKSASQKEWGLGGTYNFGVAKAFVQYQQRKVVDKTLIPDVTSKLWNIGVNVPVGTAGTFRATYVDFKNDVVNANAKATGWGISYLHNLSKRTMAYLGYQTINNGSNAAFSMQSTNNGPVAMPSAGKSTNYYGIGLRHDF